MSHETGPPHSLPTLRRRVARGLLLVALAVLAGFAYLQREGAAQGTAADIGLDSPTTFPADI